MKKLWAGIVLTAAVAAAQTAALPRVADLKFPPLREVKIPDVTTFTLPNGMRVYLLENHELPVISGTATVRTGNLFDPANKVGLAGITGTVMRTGGTKTRTGEQLDQTLENMAASVELLRKSGFRDARAATLREDWPEARKLAEEEIRAWVASRSEAGDRVIVIPG